jgi:hypothetical protein
MALNSSGPLSFGGSTTGQSINLELGVSATALASINSTAFRNLAGVASGQISVASFYGKSSVAYFIGIYGPTASAARTEINGVTVDSSGNFYFSSRAVPSTGSTNSYWSLVKYNTAGSLQFQKALATGQYSNMQNVGRDSSNNIYACGLIYDAPSGFYRTGIVKYNSSGVVQWQKYYSVGQENSGQIAVDTSGNVYVISGGSGRGNSLAKLDTSGNLQWQTDLYDGLGMRFGALTTDGTSVFVAAMQTPSFSFDTKIFLHSFSVSGGLNFSRQTSVLTYVNSSGVAYDSSGNIYLTAYYAYENSGVLIKFNSSGTLQWSLLLSTGNFQDVAVDSSGDVYVCGTDQTSNARLLVIKVNTSGTVQWKRKLGAGIPTGRGATIAIDSTGAIYAAGRSEYSGGPDKALFIKLPSDGSKTGTYTVDGNSWVYEAATITTSAGSITDSNIFLSPGTPGYPLVTTSYSQSDDSLPNTLTTI